MSWNYHPALCYHFVFVCMSLYLSILRACNHGWIPWTQTHFCEPQEALRIAERANAEHQRTGTWHTTGVSIACQNYSQSKKHMKVSVSWNYISPIIQSWISIWVVDDHAWWPTDWVFTNGDVARRLKLLEDNGDLELTLQEHTEFRKDLLSSSGTINNHSYFEVIWLKLSVSKHY